MLNMYHGASPKLSTGFRFSNLVIFLNKAMILKSPKMQIFYLPGVPH